MGGGVLERSEGLVFGEALGEVLGRLRVELVLGQTAGKGRWKMSDRCYGLLTLSCRYALGRWRMRGVLEFFEGLVAFETLSEMLGTLSSDAVVVQTATMGKASRWSRDGQEMVKGVSSKSKRT